MTITIVGAGAIGGTLGAYLARAGIPVTLVDGAREHVEAMKQRGLTITGAEEFTVAVDARLPEELDAPLGTVILAVKEQHTAAAIRGIEHLLTPESIVVSFQNGLCEEIIAGIIGAERTIGCFVNFSADYHGPALIMYAGGHATVMLGELDGSMTERLRDVQKTLSAWGAITTTDNIWGFLWGKQAYGNMLYATALADETMADAVNRFRPLMLEVATEIYQVAAAEGVRVEAFDNLEPSLYFPVENRDDARIHETFDALTAWQASSLKTKSGVWRDLAVRKRKTEITGTEHVVEMGERHGLRMPLTRKLIEMIHDLEEGRRQMSWQNLEELDALRRELNLPHPLGEREAARP
jgi:2-dehydropantoate 2-reductase